MLFLASAMDDDDDTEHSCTGSERSSASIESAAARLLPAQLLLQLREALRDAFTAAVQFVEAAREVQGMGGGGAPAERLPMSVSARESVALLLRLIAHLLAVWLAEEGESYRIQVVPLRDYLLALKLDDAVQARLKAVLDDVE